ncbi:MAG: GIY-YIG nuclease family protein [Saprospiraceae bacterium]
MIVSVYVLLSLKDGSRYVGMSQNAERRLEEHNSGKNRYTKGHLPWKIIYIEESESWEAGRVREKYFKTSAGRIYLDRKLKGNHN